MKKRNKMNKLLIGATFLLTGCVSHIQESKVPNLPELTSTVASANQWNKCFPDLSDECVSKLVEFRFVKVNQDRLNNLCGQCFADKCQNAAGCFQYDTYGIVFAPSESPTILYLNTTPLDYIIRHEFSHFASECAWGDVDRGHKNREVWNFVDNGGTCE